MDSRLPYALLADLLLVLHAAFAGFLVFGLLLIFIGKSRGWHWVGNPWFRLSHLAGIVLVALQAWMGIICPLTTWEMKLRAIAGQTSYDGTFVSYWLGRMLYLDLPDWAFIAGYSLFGILVLLAWCNIRPRPFRDNSGNPV